MSVIYAFIQMYNESQSGNLERCLSNCKLWADEIIIYDDKSTDDSVEIAKKYTSHIVLGEKSEKNELTKETFHKQTLLNYIHCMDKKPDWLLWVDCDEIIDLKSVHEIKTFCENNISNNTDAYTFQQINLWRSELYYRTDGLLYGENPHGVGWFVRLWKYHDKLSMCEKIGADQRLYPISIKIILPCDFKIIHYGFSNYKNTMKHIGVITSTKKELMDTASGDIYVHLANNGVKWAKNYVVNGKGVPNMFLNEEQLTVKKCSAEWIPYIKFGNTSVEDIYAEPKPVLNENIKIGADIMENILFIGNDMMHTMGNYCMYYFKNNIDFVNHTELLKFNYRIDYLIKHADIIVVQLDTNTCYNYDLNKICNLCSESAVIYNLSIMSNNNDESKEPNEYAKPTIINKPMTNLITNINQNAYALYQQIMENIDYFKVNEPILINNNFNCDSQEV